MTSSKNIVTLTIFIVSLKSCSSRNITGWPTAGITWYGDPNGAGSTGGACGYGDAVANSPLNGMISAGGPSMFRNGKGCGACYKILCTENPACSDEPVKVVITDECPGCTSEPVHFDLSGKSFGALAKPGQEDQLRNAGVLRVKYKRARCVYPNTNIAFHMDAGANPYYISFAVDFVDGEGNFAAVEIQPAGGANYIKMEEMRSAVWKVNSGTPLNGPFNVRLTSGRFGKVVVAKAVIPENWSPNAIYRSTVNF